MSITQQVIDSITHCGEDWLHQLKEETLESLQKLLRGNGAFSVASGVVLLAGSPWLDAAFGVDGWLLAVVGAALIGYGIQITQLAKPERAVAGGRFATAMDLAWVAGAAVMLVVFPSAMTAVGRLVLLLATLVVAGLAVGQAGALRRLGL